MSLPLMIQFALCPLVLISLLWVAAPYGRHFKPGWGYVLPNRTAWVLMEIPALLVIAIIVISSDARGISTVWFPLSLWLFHYSYRTIVFPLLMRPSQKTFPAVLVLFAIVFNCLNGYNNGSSLVASADPGASILTLKFVAGTALFVIGFVLHCHSDAVIRSIRKPGESGYGIPQRGLFKWISNPHYLGEMIQWTGWAILTWSLAGAAFALFTVCNLLPRAIANHRWYQNKFPDYPIGRRILVPGIY
jgi:protein-S-isoprenylcysteine O-methyltransferase Ste14